MLDDREARCRISDNTVDTLVVCLAQSGDTILISDVNDLQVLRAATKAIVIA